MKKNKTIVTLNAKTKENVTLQPNWTKIVTLNANTKEIITLHTLYDQTGQKIIMLKGQIGRELLL